MQDGVPPENAELAKKISKWLDEQGLHNLKKSWSYALFGLFRRNFLNWKLQSLKNEQ